MKKTTVRISKSLSSPASEIFIIDCLGPDDLQSAKRRHEDICDQLSSLSASTIKDDRNHAHHLSCQNKEDIKKSFNKIESICRQGALPLLFIDGHGDAHKGLALPSGEFINWKYYLSLLNRVISLTRGELTVVAAFCHSMAIKETLPKEKKLPFSFYYGYTNEVPAGVIETETKLIHESLIKDGGNRLHESLSDLEISSYSEYEHARELIAYALLIAWDPETLAKIFPDLSLRKLRSQYEKELAKNRIPLSGKRKEFNEITRGKSLVSKIIKELMHETTRRERLLEEITQQMDKEARDREKRVE